MDQKKVNKIIDNTIEQGLDIWFKKNRNYDITIDEYLNTSGVTNLYKDNKCLLTRVDNLQSSMYAGTSSELCLAFPDDKNIGFKNPIKKYLRNFFIYGVHLIKNKKKMYEIELLGITVFKKERKNKSNIRYWTPRQQELYKDNYYTNLKKCINKGKMDTNFLNLPKELWDAFYKDIKTQRNKNGSKKSK